MFRLWLGWLALHCALAGGVAQTTALEGKVKLLPRDLSTPRPTPLYPGEPSTGAPPPQTPPTAVVYLEDKIEGDPFAPPTTHPTIAQKDARFVPEVLAVLVGTTVDFTNLDDQLHVVTSYSRTKRFELGRYPTGQSRSVTFDKPGVVKIFCEIHDSMRAFVVVCQNPYFAVTGSDGRYRIENVPAGHHTVVCWQTRGDRTEKAINVEPGRTLTLDFK